MLREGCGAVSCDRHGASIQDLREAGMASAPKVAVKNPRQHVTRASALPEAHAHLSRAAASGSAQPLVLPLEISTHNPPSSLCACARRSPAPPNPVGLCEMIFMCLAVSLRSHLPTALGKCVVLLSFPRKTAVQTCPRLGLSLWYLLGSWGRGENVALVLRP